MKKEPTLIDSAKTRSSGNELRRMLRIFISRRIVILGFAIILVLLIGAVFSPFLAPYDPYEQNLEEALKAPGAAHWLGTDAIGRDTLSRIIYGTRTSLIIGIVAISIAAFLGMFMGLIAGYFGGKDIRFFHAVYRRTDVFPSHTHGACRRGDTWVRA